MCSTSLLNVISPRQYFWLLTMSTCRVCNLFWTYMAYETSKVSYFLSSTYPTSYSWQWAIPLCTLSCARPTSSHLLAVHVLVLNFPSHILTHVDVLLLKFLTACVSPRERKLSCDPAAGLIPLIFFIDHDALQSVCIYLGDGLAESDALRPSRHAERARPAR